MSSAHAARSFAHTMSHRRIEPHSVAREALAVNIAVHCDLALKGAVGPVLVRTACGGHRRRQLRIRVVKRAHVVVVEEQVVPIWQHTSALPSQTRDRRCGLRSRAASVAPPTPAPMMPTRSLSVDAADDHARVMDRSDLVAMLAGRILSEGVQVGREARAARDDRTGANNFLRTRFSSFQVTFSRGSPEDARACCRATNGLSCLALFEPTSPAHGAHGERLSGCGLRNARKGQYVC